MATPKPKPEPEPESDRREPARVMIYSQDSYGLGHLRRSTNLANALVAQRSDLTVLLMVDSPVAPFFDLGERIDFIKLPTVVKVGAGIFEAGRLSTGYDLVRNLRISVLREAVQQYRPDLLLVDHMPGGANRELIPTLEMIRDERLPTRLVIGLRDIIDKPEVTREVWQREGVYDTIAEFYDSVLIYGSADVYPTAEAYGLTEKVCPQIDYCGYVCNRDEAREPQRIREKLDLDDEPIVAVMAGGGADAFRLMQSYLDGAQIVNGSRRFATVMVTGPFMPEEQRKALKDQARAQGVKIHTSIGDTIGHINAAEVVVSMAGYNTLLEILRFGRKAIIVPRSGPSAEQTMRTSILESRGLVRMVHPDDLSAGTIARELTAALDDPAGPDRSALPCLEGVENASRLLLAGLRSGLRTGVAAPASPPNDAAGATRNGHVPEIVTMPEPIPGPIPGPLGRRAKGAGRGSAAR